jgi:hypothetical protein
VVAVFYAHAERLVKAGGASAGVEVGTGDRTRSELVDDDTLISTGGRFGAGRERGAILHLKPDMASLAPSNAALVKQVVDLCAKYGRHPASVAEARRSLSLPAAN